MNLLKKILLVVILLFCNKLQAFSDEFYRERIAEFAVKHRQAMNPFRDYWMVFFNEILEEINPEDPEDDDEVEVDSDDADSDGIIYLNFQETVRKKSGYIRSSLEKHMKQHPEIARVDIDQIQNIDRTAALYVMKIELLEAYLKLIKLVTIFAVKSSRNSAVLEQHWNEEELEKSEGRFGSMQRYADVYLDQAQALTEAFITYLTPSDDGGAGAAAAAAAGA